MKLPTRDEAQAFLNEHVTDEYQLHHAKMVARAMQAWAQHLGENEDLWYITGLVHDVDYQEFPETHPQESLKWYAEKDYPQELIHAVDAHYVGMGPEPQSKLAAALIACDELSGLLYAYSLMRPEKFEGMAVGKVKKQMKNVKFAAKINREDIRFGVEKLAEMTGKNPQELMDEHIALLIETFKNL